MVGQGSNASRRWTGERWGSTRRNAVTGAISPNMTKRDVDTKYHRGISSIESVERWKIRELLPPWTDEIMLGQVPGDHMSLVGK